MSNIEEALAGFAESLSIEAAQRLEVALDEAYPDDPVIQECVVALACYRPVGGEFLLDTEQIEPHLRQVRARLGIVPAHV